MCNYIFLFVHTYYIFMILNFHKFTLHNAMHYSQPRLAHHFLQYNAVLSGGVYLGKMVSETWRRPHDWGSSLKIIIFGALGVYYLGKL